MKIKGLDGREYSWNISKHSVANNNTRPRSELHLQARKLLKEIFPSYSILEELYLPGSSGLYLDFFVSQLSLAVEVHGRQHFEFVQHFHGDKLSFLKSKKRDNDKKQWLLNNNISLLELRYDETEKWRGQIIASYE